MVGQEPDRLVRLVLDLLDSGGKQVKIASRILITVGVVTILYVLGVLPVLAEDFRTFVDWVGR